MDPAESTRMLLWVLASGFLASHLETLAVSEPWMFTRLSTLWEHPGRWLNLWNGMSSFGGIVGGLLGGCIAARRRRWSRERLWVHVDALGFAFPFAWAVARFGCYLAHDHPGIRTTHWLGVQYPGGARFDLGLIDCFVALAIGALFLLFDRRPRATGFFVTAFLLLYGPARLFLDVLRIEDRWLGLTSGQYGALVATVLGGALITRLHRAGGRRRLEDQVAGRRPGGGRVRGDGPGARPAVRRSQGHSRRRLVADGGA
jgi:phosphatidylglycerol:prolipoprotein diacylglycerol transferase